METGNAGVTAVEDDDIGDGGGQVGDGGEVWGEMDPNSKRNEEGPTEEEHLVAAEMPARHSHGDEEHHAGRQQSQLDRSEHH